MVTDVRPPDLNYLMKNEIKCQQKSSKKKERKKSVVDFLVEVEMEKSPKTGCPEHFNF